MKNERRVYPVEEVCIGCHLCEIACAVEHSASKDILRAFKEETARPQARNILDEKEHHSFSLNCRHCEEPACVDACIAGALVKDPESGLVVHTPEKCVGCWSCVMTCPFGAIRMDTERGRAMKCDLCPGREIPACVEACPNRALVFEERRGDRDLPDRR